jgi:hypothetical protein
VEQFQAAYLKVTTPAELVTLGVDERGQTRLTSREMVNLERGMLERAERLAVTVNGTAFFIPRAKAPTMGSRFSKLESSDGEDRSAAA